MTALTLDLGLAGIERPSILGPDPADRREPAPVHDERAQDVPELDPRGRLTLDELLVGVWEGLTAPGSGNCAASAQCPVCHGTMLPRYGAGHGPVGGRCRDCGSTLG
jgi:hypothetical protein